MLHLLFIWLQIYSINTFIWEFILQKSMNGLITEERTFELWSSKWVLYIKLVLCNSKRLKVHTIHLSVLLWLLQLLIMTCNICVTIIASFTIIAIVAAETGVLVLFGWTRAIESIIFSVAVGMSIDFVSHLSHAFIHATPPSSKTSTCPQDQAWRVSEAFSLMGVSISTAAISTSIAGAMMYPVHPFFSLNCIYGTCNVLQLELFRIFVISIQQGMEL